MPQNGTYIDDLPYANTPLTGDEVLPVSQQTVTKKFPLASLIAWIKQQISPSDIGAVPDTRKVNNKALSSDITLTASDVGAQPTITANGILKGDGAGGVSAATPGTDYGTYSKPSGGIPASDLASGVVPAASTATPKMDGTATPGSTGQWADGGHVHPADTSKANQAQLATVESGSTASRNYLVGERFCWNGQLYWVAAPISYGEAFTPGTNCEVTTVSVEMGILCEYVVPTATMALLSDISGSAYRIGNIVVFAFQANTSAALSASTEILRIPNHMPSINGQVFTLFSGYTAGSGRVNGGTVSSVNYARFYTNSAISSGVKITITGSYFI